MQLVLMCMRPHAHALSRACAFACMRAGNGRPKKMKVLLPTAGKGFEWCMGAVRSCRELDGRVSLVL